jgi:KDO2-lipid IV(A) lauroyltransferase
MGEERTDATNRLEYILFRSIFFAVKLFPLAASSWLGRKLGALAFRILKSRRELTVENLREARDRGFLPGDTDIYRVAARTWENLCLMGIEFVYYYSCPNRRIREAVRVEGEENLKRVLERNKGAILVMAHIGNWELLGASLCAAGFGLSPVVQTQANSLLDKFINDRRRSIGMKTIPKMSFLRPIVQAFKRNEVVPLLIDQNAGKPGVPLEVFGRVARIPRGAAEFALKTGTPVVFAYILRESAGKHRLVISEEIQLSRTGDYQQDLRDNTARFIGMVQSVVSQHPDQWLWMHKLWPTDIKV